MAKWHQNEERTWTEELEVKAGEVIDRIKEALGKGSVRRLILRNAQGEVLVDVPLGAGALFGGALTLSAPLLAAVTAIIGLYANLRLEVQHEQSDQDRS